MYIIYENCCNTAMTSVTDPIRKVNSASQVIWVRIVLVGPIIREVLLQLVPEPGYQSYCSIDFQNLQNHLSQTSLNLVLVQNAYILVLFNFHSFVVLIRGLRKSSMIYCPVF